jgi:hypothetical protein
MRLSVTEHPTPGWVKFQSATLDQFPTGSNTPIYINYDKRFTLLSQLDLAI